MRVALISFSFATYMNDPFGAFCGNRVEADDATVESLEEPGSFFLRALHGHNVDRVVVRLQMLVSQKKVFQA